MRLTLIPAIHRATHRIGLYLAELREDGLSQGEAHILALLAQSNPSTVGDLHKGLAHKRSTLTSILDRLADRRLITREIGKADRRTFVIALTAEGKRVAGRTLRHLLDLEAAVKQAFPAKQLQDAVRLIAAVEDEARQRTTVKR